MLKQSTTSGGGTANIHTPLMLTLRTRRRSVVSFTLCSLYRWGKNQLETGWTSEPGLDVVLMRKFPLPVGNRTPVVESVANHNIDCVIKLVLKNKAMNSQT